MNLEDQIRLHKELSRKIEEMEEEKRGLSFAILQQMQTKTLKIPGFIVRRCSRLSIKLSIDEARSLNAVKFEETVDKDKIKALHGEGQAIKGVSEIEYIQILNLAPDSKASLKVD